MIIPVTTLESYCCKDTADLYRLIGRQQEWTEHLSAQVAALTHRLNALSDKVTDQSVVIGKLLD